MQLSVPAALYDLGPQRADRMRNDLETTEKTRAHAPPAVGKKRFDPDPSTGCHIADDIVWVAHTLSSVFPSVPILLVSAYVTLVERRRCICIKNKSVNERSTREGGERGTLLIFDTRKRKQT